MELIFCYGFDGGSRINRHNRSIRQEVERICALSHEVSGRVRCKLPGLFVIRGSAVVKPEVDAALLLARSGQRVDGSRCARSAERGSICEKR